MTKEAFEANALPDDFVTTVGKLLEIRGPVVDMEFPPHQRPPLLSVLRITDDTRSTTFDATVSWSGFRGLTLQAGLRNAFNEDPPYTNQATTFQSNYDPRYTDPLGRTFIARASYKFF